MVLGEFIHRNSHTRQLSEELGLGFRDGTNRLEPGLERGDERRPGRLVRRVERGLLLFRRQLPKEMVRDSSQHLRLSPIRSPAVHASNRLDEIFCRHGTFVAASPEKQSGSLWQPTSRRSGKFVV